MSEWKDDERDAAVKRVLSAMGRVEMPEGMEARIAAGVARRALAEERAKFRWRDVVRGSAVAGAWWRGAMSGAAVAAIVLVAGAGVAHRMRVAPAARTAGGQASFAARASAGAVPPPASMAGVVRGGSGRPCGGAVAPRVDGVARMPRSGMLRVENVVSPRPAREPALTAEERGLVRLVRLGNPQELALLNPEVRARQEAQETAEFQSFFARPVEKVEARPASDSSPVAAAETVDATMKDSATETEDAAQDSTERGSR